MSRADQDPHVLLGRIIDAATDLTHLSRRAHVVDVIGNQQRVEMATELVIELARELTSSYIRGLPNDSPSKGLGNRLADAIGSLDAARLSASSGDLKR